MKTNRSSIFSTGLTLALLAVAAVGVAPACSAQAQSAPHGTSSSMLTANFPPAESYSYVFLDPLEGNHHAARVDDGSHQGFQMHGHWIIDVKNPDGTIAQHRDFENTLLPQGDSYLLGLMAGYWVPSDYAIGLNFGSPNTPCAQALSNTSGCVLVHSTYTDPAKTLCLSYTCFSGLTYTVANLFTGGPPSITFAGSFAATQAGTISDVSTFSGACPYNSNTSLATVSPSTCSKTNPEDSYAAIVSSANITPVPVVASQIIQVSVTISFS